MSTIAKEATEARIRKALGELNGIEPDIIRPDNDFIVDLNMDSLDLIESVMCVEEELEIELPDEKLDGITTVQQLYDVVHEVMARTH